MAKNIFALCVWAFLAAFAGGFAAPVVYAKEAASQPAKPVDPEEVSRKAEEAAKKARAAEAKARETLKSQEWTVYLTTEDGKSTGETEVIAFTGEGKVSLKNLSAKDYTDSNFRLTVGDDGTIVWETMKVNPDKDLAFLRGDLRSKVMKGSIFFKPQKGAQQTLYFSTVNPGTNQAVSPEEQTKKEASPKKKKGK